MMPKRKTEIIEPIWKAPIVALRSTWTSDILGQQSKYTKVGGVAVKCWLVVILIYKKIEGMPISSNRPYGFGSTTSRYWQNVRLKVRCIVIMVVCSHQPQTCLRGPTLSMAYTSPLLFYQEPTIRRRRHTSESGIVANGNREGQDPGYHNRCLPAMAPTRDPAFSWVSRTIPINGTRNTGASIGNLQSVSAVSQCTLTAWE